MTNPKLILLVVYLIAGMAFIVASLPLIRGRVVPNALYGFRVKRTLEDPSVWYPVNRFAAWHMLGLGIVVIMSASVLYALPAVGFIQYAIACVTLVLTGLGISLVRTFRYLSRFNK